MPQNMIAFEDRVAYWTEGLLRPVIDIGNFVRWCKLRHGIVLLVGRDVGLIDSNLPGSNRLI